MGLVRLFRAGPPIFSCARGGVGFRGWGTGARGSAKKEANMPPGGGSRSGPDCQRGWNPLLFPHSPFRWAPSGNGDVEGAPASESWRTRVGAPTGRNLLGGSQDAEFARSWGTRRPSRGAPWALRRLRTHWCPGKGFMAARLLSHVAPRAFYMGFAWGLLGPLQPLPPSPPPLLRPTLKPKAAWVLDGGVPP